MHSTILLLLYLTLLKSITAKQQQTNKIQSRNIPSQNNLFTRQTNNNQSNFSQNCYSYYSANTPHAVCNGDRSIMCLSGCTGGIVAQNCKSNSSSLPSTQTCSIAFSQTSDTSFLCNTPQGAFTCIGPSSGNIACHGCVSIPDGVVASNSSLIVNGTSMTGAPESHLSTGDNQQDSSAPSIPLFLPKSTLFVISPAILICLWLGSTI